jgi:inner membrane protein
MSVVDRVNSPGSKLGLAIVIGLVLTIPLFCVWLLVYDRQSQSVTATASITEGWGRAQRTNGPMLVIPYKTRVAQTVEVPVPSGTIGTPTTRTEIVEEEHELGIAPEAVQLDTKVSSEPRKRSIYEAVLFDATNSGSARFAFPPDLERYGIDPASLEYNRAELRFGVSDPRGLGANPVVKLDGRPVRLQPGNGSASGSGFFAFVDAGALRQRNLVVEFAYKLRGNGSLGLLPQAGDTQWSVSSNWKDPSFKGGYLPTRRQVGQDGFAANYRIGNLALGKSLVVLDTAKPAEPDPTATEEAISPMNDAVVEFVQPVDLYSQVDRATKYGFLFIGFTFITLLMFDIIGGVRVSPVEYLLMGAAIVLFFALLLAFAEVIGFAWAYVVASAAIAGLNTSYSAAILKSWKRGGFIGALLVGLYAVLYILLNLEAYSLLIGSVLLFVALAGVMYATRRIDWSSLTGNAEATA